MLSGYFEKRCEVLISCFYEIMLQVERYILLAQYSTNVLVVQVLNPMSPGSLRLWNWGD